MALSQTVSINIRELRKRAGLSQQKLAERSNLSVRYISRLETTAQNITLEALERVAAGLGCPVAMLVDDRNNSSWQLHERLLQKTATAVEVFEKSVQDAISSFRDTLLTP